MSHDNLNFGETIPLDANANRDATHVAVVPVIAGEALSAADHVGVRRINGVFIALKHGPHHCGIVDPFLSRPVMPNERFWLFLFPRTTTGMRHHWSHPDFDEAKDQQPLTGSNFAAPDEPNQAPATTISSPPVPAAMAGFPTRTAANRYLIAYAREIAEVVEGFNLTTLLAAAERWIHEQRPFSYPGVNVFTVSDEFWQAYRICYASMGLAVPAEPINLGNFFVDGPAIEESDEDEDEDEASDDGEGYRPCAC